MEKILELKEISKKFGDFQANKKISFDLYRGEILTILGENGAGKSTLMNIITGFYRSDDGEIYVKGEKVTLNSPKDAIKHGIGMVHQHFMLVKNLTVFENLLVSLKEKRFIINKSRYANIFLNIFYQKSLILSRK